MATKPDHVPATWRGLSAELVIRRDRTMRFERNAAVYATDGRIGTLRQVLIDKNSGEVTDIVVTIKALGKSVRMPVSVVDRTGGSAVFLRIDREMVQDGAQALPDFDRTGFKRTSARKLREQAAEAVAQGRELGVGEFGADYLETRSVRRYDLIARASRASNPGAAD